LLVCPSSAPYIRILIVKDKPALVDLFIDLLTGDLQSFKLDTATDADRVVPGVGYAQLASDTPGREALATGESVRGPEAMEAEEPGGPALVMTFTDTGIGIAPEDMPKVMAPFFTTKEASKGTG
jgi:signal transduction histidine kinase